MNIYELFPSKWVRAADLNGHNVTVTMRALVVENIGQPPKNEDKPILYFQKTEKGLVLNKTNAMIISSIYGPDTDNWMGKPIQLYATKVKAFGAVHDVIRIRDHVQTVSAAPDPIVDADDDVVFDDEDHDPVAAPPDDANAKPSQRTNGNGNGAQTAASATYADDGKGHTFEPEEDNPFDDVPENVRKAFHATGTALYGKDWNAKRHELVKTLTDGRAESSNELTESELKRLTAGMAAKLAASQQPDSKVQEVAV